jgi:hypothetical protein
VKLSIILSTLLSTFATTAPDLCADVFLDASGDPITDLVGQTLSRFCKWTGPDVPAWDADVCCTFADDAAQCSATDTRGRCPSGTAKRYCEHGSLGADGRVTCYQPFPDACEAGWCIEAPETIPEAQMSEYMMCCAGGVCTYVVFGHSSDCFGEILACDYGFVDENGFVECWE